MLHRQGNLLDRPQINPLFSPFPIRTRTRVCRPPRAFVMGERSWALLTKRRALGTEIRVGFRPLSVLNPPSSHQPGPHLSGDLRNRPAPKFVTQPRIRAGIFWETGNRTDLLGGSRCGLTEGVSASAAFSYHPARVKPERHLASRFRISLHGRPPRRALAGAPKGDRNDVPSMAMRTMAYGGQPGRFHPASPTLRSPCAPVTPGHTPPAGDRPQ